MQVLLRARKERKLRMAMIALQGREKENNRNLITYKMYKYHSGVISNTFIIVISDSYPLPEDLPEALLTFNFSRKIKKIVQTNLPSGEGLSN